MARKPWVGELNFPFETGKVVINRLSNTLAWFPYIWISMICFGLGHFVCQVAISVEPSFDVGKQRFDVRRALAMGEEHIVFPMEIYKFIFP